MPGKSVFLLALLFVYEHSLAQALPSPGELPANVELVGDLVFAEYADRSLQLDLYRPIAMSEKVPAIVVISEGGWEPASKELNGPMAAALAARGFIAVSIDYRGASEAVFPASVHDTKAAVRWLRANADTYNIDADAIGAIGGSWGGYLSVFAGMTDGITELEGDGGANGYSSTLHAVVGLSAPTDVTGFVDSMERYIGPSYRSDPDLWEFASATSHVKAGSPPLLLIASQADSTVPFTQSMEMTRLYGEAGLPVELVLLPDAGHSFWHFGLLFEQTLDRAADFFQTHLER